MVTKIETVVQQGKGCSKWVPTLRCDSGASLTRRVKLREAVQSFESRDGEEQSEESESRTDSESAA